MRRGLMLLLVLVVLAVQTSLPAHQDSHPIGSPDNHCQYCVMAGHAVGVPGVAIQAPLPPVYARHQGTKPVEIHARPLPRTLFSRGPPLDPFV
jgi:hypothetical protein